MQAGRLYDIKFHTHDETSKDEKQHDSVDKYNRSVFWTVASHQKTGPIHLVLVHGKLAGWQADENLDFTS